MRLELRLKLLLLICVLSVESDFRDVLVGSA